MKKLPKKPKGFYDDMPEDLYHGHAGSLSNSGAKLLLQAPAIFRHRLDNPVHKDEFDVGSAAHKLVLGVGAELVIVDANDWRTKAAQEAKAAAHAAGQIPLLTKTHAQVVAMADKLSEHRLAMELLSEGKPEVSAFAPDDETGVLRRCRFDWLGSSILTDYKTTTCADPDVFVKQAANLHYGSQEDWYLGVAADLGHPADAFAFIAQEKEPPYLVTVVELPVELVDLGAARNRRALQMFRDCTESGLWPGYVPDTEIARPAAPGWVLREVNNS